MSDAKSTPKKTARKKATAKKATAKAKTTAKPAKAKAEKPKRVPFMERLTAAMKGLKPNKDGQIVVSGSRMEKAGLPGSARKHAAYWRSYNNAGYKAAQEMGFQASLSVTAEKGAMLTLTPLAAAAK